MTESSRSKKWESRDRFTPSTSSQVAKLSLNSHFPNLKTPGKQYILLSKPLKTLCDKILLFTANLTNLYKKILHISHPSYSEIRAEVAQLLDFDSFFHSVWKLCNIKMLPLLLLQEHVLCTSVVIVLLQESTVRGGQLSKERAVVRCRSS